MLCIRRKHCVNRRYQGLAASVERDPEERRTCSAPPGAGAGARGGEHAVTPVVSGPPFFAAAGEKDHSLPRDMQPSRHDGPHEQQAPTAAWRARACNAGIIGPAGAPRRCRNLSLFFELLMRARTPGAHPSALVDEAPSLAAVLLLQPVRKIAAGVEAGGRLRDHVAQERRGGPGACSLIGATGGAPANQLAFGPALPASSGRVNNSGSNIG
jgi:hypothetical protein